MLYHANGDGGALDPAIQPLDPERGLVGPAYTVETEAGDNLALHRAVARAPEGSVLVVDAKGCRDVATAGDLLALAAKERGVAGMIVDGAVRDRAAVVAMGFPMFARGIAVAGPVKKSPGAIGSAVECGGIEVLPGDLVVGDADGVVVVSRDDWRAVMERAEIRAAFERDVRDGLRAGKTTLELFGLGDREGD